MASTAAYRLYTFTIPLRYNSLDIFSIQKDHEYVVGLDGEMEWEKDNVLDIVAAGDDMGRTNAYMDCIRKQYPQYKCRVTSVYRKMNESSTNQEQNTYPPQIDTQREFDALNIIEPVGSSSQTVTNVADNSSYKDYEIANEYLLTVENLVAKDMSDALAILEPEIATVCNALSIMLASNNCNKQLFQPRVVPDWDRRHVDEKSITLQNKQSRSYLDKDGNQVYEIHAGIQVSVECFAKLYSKISIGELSAWLKPCSSHYQYVMQEYCAALGTEGLRSKYFHLFCIIEFIEREYSELAGAEKILNDEQIDFLDKKFKNILKSTDIDKSFQSDVASGVKARMMGMTTAGRAQKLVNILHAMGVKNVTDGGIEFKVDKKHMQKHIDTRNTLFHGNDFDKELRDLVTELMCIDIKVLEYLRNNGDVQK